MAGKYVCNGAIIKCPLCSNPQGKLLVTSTQILIQDKPWATEADKGKMNLQFQGTCTKFTNNPPPCIGVINVAQWQNVAEGVTVDGNAPLLEDSTIMCNTGGVQITIENHVQKSIPTNLSQLAMAAVPAPMAEEVLEPKVVEMYWMDEEKTKRVDGSNYGDKVHLFIKAINTDPGMPVSIKVKDVEAADFAEGQKELIYSGTVDSEGVAELELVELEKSWIKTEKKENDGEETDRI